MNGEFLRAEQPLELPERRLLPPAGPVMRGIGLVVIVGTLLSGCRVVEPRPHAFGADYFGTDFTCKTGKLVHEDREDYLSTYRLIRKMFAEDNARRGEAFAVLTGDSTAMLFTQEHIDKLLPDADLVNRGIGGDTTRMLPERFAADVLSLKPRVVFLAVGGNDLLLGRCIPIVLDNIRKLLEMSRRNSPKTLIYLVSVPPVITWKANSITPFFNRRLEYLADLFPNAEFMDLWPLLSRDDVPGLKQEFYFKYNDRFDPIHFNEAGYRLWAVRLGQIIADLQDQEPKKSGPEKSEKNSTP